MVAAPPQRAQRASADPSLNPPSTSHVDDVWRDGALDVGAACAFVGCRRSWLFEAMERGDIAWAPLGGKAGAKRVIARVSLVELLRRSAAARTVNG